VITVPASATLAAAHPPVRTVRELPPGLDAGTVGLLSGLVGYDLSPDTLHLPELAERTGRADFGAWLPHVTRARGCTRPVRLAGHTTTVDTRSGEAVDQLDTSAMPDGVLYKPCGTRRASVCPACAEVYRWDTYHLIRAGLAGGKSVPDTVASHPAVFATFTAPSFGPVHTRVIDKRTGRVLPCRARRDRPTCAHGRPAFCPQRHHDTDPCLGRPLCLDCYDHDHQAVWNHHAPELWSRTALTLGRSLRRAARVAGVAPNRVRVRYAKVAEYQRRGVVHFHALIRLDGADPGDPALILPPPAGLGVELLTELVAHAAATTALMTPPHPDQPDGWPLMWGSVGSHRHADIRPVNRGLPADAITAAHVAGYLAKYATKATEPVGLQASRVTAATIDALTTRDDHPARLLDACWMLGRPDAGPAWTRLRAWAHMLGFGGHFSTRSRRYSTTLGALRAARRPNPRTGPRAVDADTARALADQDDQLTTVVIGSWSYAGSGWLTTADAALAAMAADAARSRRPLHDPHALTARDAA
jgi:hypothetical protein